MRTLLFLLVALVAAASCLQFHSNDARVSINGDAALPAVVNVDTNTNKLEISYPFGVRELELYSSNSRYQTCPGGGCQNFVMVYDGVDYSYRAGTRSSNTVGSVPTYSYTYTTSNGVTNTLWVDRDNTDRIRKVKQIGAGVDRVITFNDFLSGATFGNVPTTCNAVQCTSAIDLLMVLDTSGSISDSDFIEEKNFARQVVNSFTVSSLGVHVGLVTFSTTVRSLDRLTGNQTTIERAIDAVFPPSGQTNIGEAIKAAQTELNTRGRADIPKVILLLTDGKANEPSGGSAESYAVAQANAAKSAGTIIYVIGVGTAINQENLERIASSPSSSYTTFVNNFRALQTTINNLLAQVCTGGDTNLCAEKNCGSSQYCGCGGCVCTITSCSLGTLNRNTCACQCESPRTTDCSSCAYTCKNGGTQNSDCTCKCPTGRGGPTCEICTYQCNANQEMIGQCGGCRCKSGTGWTGPTCSTCDPNFCGANGRVVNNGKCDSCVCNPGFGGPKCDQCILNCNGGVRRSDCSGCSSCPNGFTTASNCTVCTTADPAPFCNNHGTVNPNGCNSCTCRAPWGGNSGKCDECKFDCRGGKANSNCNGCSNCKDKTAFTTASNCTVCNTSAKSSFCSGRGAVNNANGLCDTCTCPPPYSGKTCSTCDYTCYNGGTKNNDCNGCNCPGDTNWKSSSDCQVCDRTPKNSYCSGRGYVNNTACNSCSCDYPWGGRKCTDCALNCKGGRKLPNCAGCASCPAGWTTSSNCTVCDASPRAGYCNNNGYISQTDGTCSKCICAENYGGERCEKCIFNCGVGGVADTTRCDRCISCRGHYTASSKCTYCPTNTDYGFCKHGGRINNTNGQCNTCQCPYPWGGTDCSQCVFECIRGVPNPTCTGCENCPGAFTSASNCRTCDTSNNLSYCRNRGRINNTATGCNTCSCNEPWKGTRCEVCDFKCGSGKANVDCTGCQSCPGGFTTASNCSVCDTSKNHPLCNGRGRIDNSNGKCNTCVCNPGFGGEQGKCEKCVFDCRGGTVNVATCNSCTNCPNQYTTASNCTECNPDPNIAYCRGRGKMDLKNGNCDRCSCRYPWTGKTCNDCAFDCNGGKAFANCTGCENCPAGTALLPQTGCTACDMSQNATFCNARGSIKNATSCNSCNCKAPWSGNQCTECNYQCAHGTRNKNCTGCDCPVQYTGKDCSICDPSPKAAFCHGRGHIDPRSNCDSCKCTENKWSGATCNVCPLDCNGNGVPNANCTACVCDANTGYTPENNCAQCSLICPEHSKANEDCTACVCVDHYSGHNCQECDATYTTRCRNNATISPATNCQCDCDDLFSGEFCTECDPNTFCGNGTLFNVPVGGRPTCECECAEYFVGHRCDVCGLATLEEACSGIAEPDLSTCTCHCPQYYRDEEGCRECILVPEQCRNNGTFNTTILQEGRSLTPEECACDCPEPWAGRDCSICTTECDNTAGYYLDETKCACYTICEDGIVAGLEECEKRLANSTDRVCCQECRFRNVTCDDEVFCTVDDVCSSGVCEGKARTCTDDNQCTTSRCDAELDKCVNENVEDRTSCSDGNACSLNDVCIEGVCTAGPEKVCDAHKNDTCIIDYCRAGKCVTRDSEVDTPCDDGNPCTIGDLCVDGDCKAGPPLLCEVNPDPCLTNICIDGACAPIVTAGIVPCDDGNSCTIGDFCKEGICISGPYLECNKSSNPCVNNTCVNGECLEVALELPDIPCASGDSCMVGGLCDAGVCVEHARDCNDGNICTDNYCEDGECQTSNNNITCVDSNLCNLQGVCTDGECTGTPRECPDSEDNACMEGYCRLVDGECDLRPVDDNVSCDDANACTVGDACEAGKCRPGMPVVCTSEEVCLEAYCAEGKCVTRPVEGEVECDDGDACTEQDMCVAGECLGTPIVCNDTNICTDDKCVEGQCVFTSNDLTCDDGDGCTENDMCKEGECVGTPITCKQDELDVCNKYLCISDECVRRPVDNRTSCDDGNSCTENDYCVSGECVGVPIVCDDESPCTNDVCVDGECVFTPGENIGEVCDDGNSCTVKDVCDPNGCKGTPLNCDDGNPCTVDTCKDGKCVNVGTTESNIPCDDGVACTENDVCVGKDCRGVEKDCSSEDGCLRGFCSEEEGGVCKIIPALVCTPRPGLCEGAQCVDGACVYTGTECNDFNGCTNDFCRDGECVFEDVVCDDQLSCTDDECVDNECRFTPVECPIRDGGCEIGVCDELRGCNYTRRNCEDGDECTLNYCENGECITKLIICTDDDDNLCTIPSCEKGECVDTLFECADDDDGVEDGYNDDDDCVDHYCVDGECKERLNCVIPPLELPSETPTPSPSRRRIVAGAAAAGTSESGVRVGNHAEQAVVGGYSTLTVGGTGAMAVGVFAIFAVVVGLNNTKKDPATPAIAALMETEMSSAAHENPVFMASLGAHENIIG